MADGLPGELPGEDHPGHAQLGAAAHPVQGVDGELGGAVDGQTGSGLPEHPQDAQVLDEDGVHPNLGGLGGRPGGGGELPVGDQGVEGEVDLGPPDMAVRNRRGQFLQREVLGIAAGVEIPAAQVDGVGAGLDGGGDGFRRPGGGEQFQHGNVLQGEILSAPLVILSDSEESASSVFVRDRKGKGRGLRILRPCGLRMTREKEASGIGARCGVGRRLSSLRPHWGPAPAVTAYAGGTGKSGCSISPPPGRCGSRRGATGGHRPPLRNRRRKCG